MRGRRLPRQRCAALTIETASLLSRFDEHQPSRYSQARLSSFHEVAVRCSSFIFKPYPSSTNSRLLANRRYRLLVDLNMRPHPAWGGLCLCVERQGPKRVASLYLLTPASAPGGIFLLPKHNGRTIHKIRYCYDQSNLGGRPFLVQRPLELPDFGTTARWRQKSSTI